MYRAHRRFIGPNTVASPTCHPERRGVMLSKAKDPELVLSAASLTCHAQTLSENSMGYSAYRVEISSLYTTLLKGYERSI